MAWEKERRHLNKQTPERVSFVEWPRAGISVLIRRFPVVFEKTEEQSAIDFLGQYGDPAAVAPSTTVENPVAGGKAYPGVFRSVKVETGKIKGREETQGIYQTLVTGSFREAGWVRVENNCQYVVDQEIYWSTDVRPPLPANSPGVEYSYAQQSYDRDTGLYVVIIERRTRLYQYDSRVSEISPLSTTETTQQLGVTSQAVAPLLDERGVLARRTTSLNRDCSKDLVTETDRARPFGPFIDLHGGALVRESVSLLSNQLQPPNPGPGGLGVLIDVSPSINRYGLIDSQETRRTAVPFGPWSSVHGGPLVRETVVGDLNQAAALSPGAGGVGLQIDVSQNANQFGLYDRQKTTREALPFGPWASTHGSPLVEETVQGDLNQAAPLSPGAGGAGYQVDVSQGANPFGLYDRTLTSRRAKPFGPWISVHGGPLVTETVTGDLNQAAPLSPGAGAAGYQVDVSQGANAFGLYDRTKTVRQAMAFGPWVSTHGGPLVRETIQGDLNQPVALNPGPGGPGYQVDVSQGANPFGLYDRTKTTRQALPFGPWTSIHGGPLVEETVVGDLNQPGPHSPGRGAAGYQVDVSQGANPFGLYDRTKTTRRALPFGPWTSIHGGVLVRETVVGDLNQPSAMSPGPGAAGVTVDVSQGANPFGLYDRTKTTREAQPFGPWVSVHGGALVEETVEGDLNQAAPLNPGAGAAGVTVDVSQGANPFGLYDRTLTRRRALPFGPWTSTHGGALVRETVQGDLNQPAPLNPGPGGAGITVDVSQGANPFGLYDRTKTTRQALPFGPWTSVHGSALVRETVEGDLNQSAPLSPGAGSAGVTIDVSQGANPFGLYDRTKTTRQALPFGPWTSIHGGVLVRETVQGDVNQADFLNPGPGAAGYQVDVSQNVNPFGLYDRVKTERQAIAFGPWTSTHGGPVVEETVEGDLNQPTALNPGAGATGTTIDVSQSVNPFGLYDRQKTTRRARPFNWSFNAGGPIYRESVSGFLNGPAAQSPGPGGTGVVTDVNQSLNAFGLYDGAVITRTALPFGPWTSVHGGPLVEETVEGAMNQPSALSPGAGSAGFTIDVSQNANSYGLYDRTKTQRRAIAFGPWSSVHGSPLMRETVEGALNQPSAISPGAGAAGFSIDVSQNVNPFGLYDRVKTTREALPADTGWIATTEDTGFRSESRSFRNKTLAEVQAIASTIGGAYRGRCFAHYNDFGLLDGQASRQPKLIQIGGFDTPVSLTYNVKHEKPREGYTYSVDERITSSKNTAENHANNTLSHVGGIAGGVRYLGNGIYKAVKIS